MHTALCEKFGGLLVPNPVAVGMFSMMDPGSDHELLHRFAQSDDAQAFRILVERHLPAVRAQAIARTQRVDLADDLAQETFGLLAREAKRIKATTVVSGWLFLVVRNLAHKAVRAERRRRLREHRFTHDPAMHPSPPLDLEKLQTLLIDAMDHLRTHERDVLLLRYFENRSFKDIATLTGGSEEAIRKCASRSLEKLRPLLARKGITSTAVILGSAIQGMAATPAPVGMAATVSAKAIALAATGTAATLTLTLSSITTLAFMHTKTLLTAAALLAAIGTTGYLVVHSETPPRVAKPTNVRPSAEVASEPADSAAASSVEGERRSPIVSFPNRHTDAEEARQLASAKSYSDSQDKEIGEAIRNYKLAIAAAKAPDFAEEKIQASLATLPKHLELDEATLSQATESLRAYERQQELKKLEPALAKAEQAARCKMELRETVHAILLADDNRAAFEQVSNAWSNETKTFVLDYLVKNSFMEDFRNPPLDKTAENNPMEASDWSEFPDAVSAIRKTMPGDQLEKFDQFTGNRSDIVREGRAFNRSQELAESLQLDATQRDAVFQELMTSKKEDPAKIKALLNESQARDYQD